MENCLELGAPHRQTNPVIVSLEGNGKKWQEKVLQVEQGSLESRENNQRMEYVSIKSHYSNPMVMYDISHESHHNCCNR